MRIAVLFARLGPYHVARLQALSTSHDVVAVELSGENINYDWNPIDVEGLQHVQLFDTNHRTVPIPQLRDALHAVLRRYQPDVVAVPGWWDPGALAAIEWCQTHTTPVVLMSDSTAIDAPRVAWREWPKRQVVDLCGSALVAGTRHETYARRLGMPAERIFTGYDVVDNAHFAAGAEAARSSAQSLHAARNLPHNYFMACCRFIEKKNLSRLLTAYATYRQRAERNGGSPWSLVLVGDGPLRGALEKQVQDLGLAKAVRFPGFCQYEDLPVYYGLARAFVHVSTHEQWGLVVNEAMAAGLPVLVSERCGCTPDLVVDDRNGYTVDPYASDEIARGLHRLAHEGGNLEQMGHESRQIIDHWTPQTFARNMGKAAEAARVASLDGGLSWPRQALLHGLMWKEAPLPSWT
mgnify:CR=1 FL=1